MSAFQTAESDGRYLVTVSKAGLAKKTPLKEYPTKGRATGGVQLTGLAPKDAITGIALADAKDQLLVWTDGEECIRIAAKEIATGARDRKGSRPASIPKDGTVAGLARTSD